MRHIPLFACILLLAGCNPPQDTAGNEAAASPSPAEEAVADAVGAAETPVPKPSTADIAMANTAWRVTGEEGAIYTTFLDPDGRYRDLKNGDPWQEGTWERLADGRLCFTPEDETRSGACWTLGKESDEGTMRVTSDAGREVELQQVTYIAALDEAEG
ncbi:hypothetical protein [Altererythrobacter litoralis]|uniref:Uncharacterized protein n=1 Tax=Altererythrobacter litoralis TaxID=3113904 RepID=A0ABU7GBY0_9SPHN|nr:hypothetical protein [Erythrobacteraceae bacterium 1XM1-14]